MKSIMAVLVMSLLVAESIQAQAPDPVGEQFQLNSYTTSYQRVPALATDSQGDFVVVWISGGSDGTDSSYSSIQAQRYEANGTVVGRQFQVNSYTTSYQWRVAVAADTQGDFVVAWNSSGSDGTDTSSYSIQAQRYDANGTTVGGQFQVNSYTTSYQYNPGVAVYAQGDFVVVWASLGSDGTDTSSYSIQAQRFNANGEPVGGEFQVNSYTTSNQWRPAVAADTQGEFVVVWASLGSDGADTSSWSIQAQRYDADGAAVGGEFQVNSYTTNYQGGVGVAADTQGEFVVAWTSDGSYSTDTNSFSIQAQRFNASGEPVGGEFQVNSYTTSNQLRPAVAADSQGDFVVVWDSDGSYGADTSSTSIQGQRFQTPIFADGFESGDISAWSTTVP